MTTLTFQNTNLSVINQNAQAWLLASEIGKALGYPHPIKGIQKIYDRHSDEFTPQMTALIEMQTAGGIQKVRIFSLRGAHLIGMLSHTKVAKEFRKWVLDVLDRETAEPKQLALPEPEKTFSFEFTEYELQQLAWLWFAFKRGVGTFQHIHPAFKRMGSDMSAQIYGQGYEYLSVLRATNQILNRITKGIDIDPMSNWRVLQHLRQFNPKAVKIDR